VNGKAKVVRDELCDGAGFCLGVCPTGALVIEERDAPEFNAKAAEERQAQLGKRLLGETCFRCKASEEETVLIPCRTQGSSKWVCVHCLPPLIHG
jgi:Fe-S-cluster-containing hydrogenase component 2